MSAAHPGTATSPGSPVAAPLWGLERKWWIALSVVPAIAVAEMSFSTELLPSPQILQALDTDKYRYQWAIWPYIVLLIVWVSVAPKLQQMFGGRRLFLTGIAGVAIGCLVASQSSSVPQILVARLLMSLKGLALATGIGQLWNAFPRRKGLAMAMSGTAMFGGIGLGVALGGLVAYHPSWRTFYLICSAAAAALWLLEVLVLPDDRPARRIRVPMDWPGILLLATFVNGAMAVIIWGSYLDWTTSPWICLAIASMVVAVPLFVWRELVTPQPVADVRMFANRTVALAMISLGFYAAAYVGTLLVLPGYTLLRGYPTFTTGLMMLPPSTVLLISLVTSGLVSDRTHTVRTMQAGLVIIAVASWQLTRLDLYTSKYWIVAVLSVWAAGIGMVLPTALRLTFQGQTPEQVNRTGSIKTMLRLGSIIIGGNVGAVIVTRGTDWGLDHLGSNVTALDPAVIDTTSRLALHMQHVGATVETAGRQADAVVGWWFHQNAAALGYQQVMWYFMALNAAGLVAALLIRAKPELSILDTDDPTTLGGLLGQPSGPA